MNKIVLSALGAMVVVCSALAEVKTEAPKAKPGPYQHVIDYGAGKWTIPLEYKNADGKVFRYRWHEPAKIEAGKKYPLVIFFHGAGERGVNNIAQLVHGATPLLQWAMKNGDCFFIAGQVPNGKRWVEVPWEAKSHTMPKDPSETMGMALEVLEQTMKNPAVDLNRVYACGISMGGYGTWDAIMRHPDWFAAAMPICGGADVNEAARVAKLPIWTFHGGADTVVPTFRSQSIVEALKKCGSDVKYTEVPNCGHCVWNFVFNNPEHIAWLFSNVKK